MIVIDWGTTSFRAYRLTEDGTVCDRRHATLGILTVPDGDFGAALASQIADWLPLETNDILLGGMIGSRQGWVETPYATCPAGAGDIAAAATAFDWHGRRLRIAPGVRSVDADGVPDVMRGEEVQILGILDTLGAAPATVCLPGTHSKWVTVEEGRILAFRTYMTGESFALYRKHSILGRLMPEGPDAEAGHTFARGDELAFARGIDRSGTEGGLLNHLFEVRSLGLFDALPAIEQASYLSGLLIGHELRAALRHVPKGAVHLVATPKLATLYEGALARLDRTAVVHAPDAAVRGLALLADIRP